MIQTNEKNTAKIYYATQVKTWLNSFENGKITIL